MAESTAMVLDPSVAVRWLVQEVGTAEAVALLDEPLAWRAPRLLLTEAASALRRKASGNEIRVDIALQAIQALVDAVDDGVIRLADDEDLVIAALTLALAAGHKLPDCLYVALAEREGAGLATADRQLAALARSRGIAVRTVPSA